MYAVLYLLSINLWYSDCFYICPWDYDWYIYKIMLDTYRFADKHSSQLTISNCQSSTIIYFILLMWGYFPYRCLQHVPIFLLYYFFMHVLIAHHLPWAYMGPHHSYSYLYFRHVWVHIRLLFSTKMNCCNWEEARPFPVNDFIKSPFKVKLPSKAFYVQASKMPHRDILVLSH